MKLNFKLLLLLLLPFLISLGLIYALSFPHYKLFPHGKQDVYFFSDTDEGGNTSIKSSKSENEKIEMLFQLNSGFAFPFAGIAVNPSGDDQFCDISQFNQVEIELQHDNFKSLDIALVTFNINCSSLDNPRSMRHDFVKVLLKKGVNKYVIDLNDFRISDWWLEECGKTPDVLGNPDWNKVSSCSITAQLPIDPKKNQSLIIKKLNFKRNIWPIITPIVTLLFLYYVILFIYHFSKRKNKEVKVTYEQIKPTIEVDKEESTIDEITRYLTTNYNDPTLSLSKLSEEFPWSEKHISGLIKKHYFVPFREYLNGIRIEEAKRLLLSTDKNISEVAYLVGFNSPNSFNRVFKKIVELAPRDFRIKNNLTAN